MPLRLMMLAPLLAQALLVAAQSGPELPRAVSAPDDPLVLSLVQQSHELNAMAPVPLQISLLERQARLAARLSPELAANWATEMFQLATTPQGASAQMRAMDLIEQIDPDRALELLTQLSSLESDSIFPAATTIRSRAFRAVAARDGEAALPKLRQQAERLGASGEYPYNAFAQGVMIMVTKFPDNDAGHQHAMELMGSAMQQMYDRYRRTPTHSMREFAEFSSVLLAADRVHVPKEKIRSVLRGFVDDVLAAGDATPFLATVTDKAGKTASVHTARDAILLRIGRVIEATDPEIAARVQAARPDLNAALPLTASQAAMTLGPVAHGMPNVDSETQVHAMNLARSNVEAAIARAKQSPDPNRRAATLLQLARDVAEENSQRATQIVTEIETGSPNPDPQLRLNLAATRLTIAAVTGDEQSANQLLRQACESARRQIAEMQQNGTILLALSGLETMVEIGVQTDPAVTFDFIQGLPPSPLKASALLSAAEGLSARVPRPRRQHPSEPR